MIYRYPILVNTQIDWVRKKLENCYSLTTFFSFAHFQVKEPNLIQIVKEFQEEKPLSNCIIFTKTCRYSTKLTVFCQLLFIIFSLSPFEGIFDWFSPLLFNRTCQILSRLLSKCGFSCAALHSMMNQRKRFDSLHLFKSKQVCPWMLKDLSLSKRIIDNHKFKFDRLYNFAVRIKFSKDMRKRYFKRGSLNNFKILIYYIY